MRHFWQWFCGYVCVSLSGRQVNRFLNLCSRNGIFLWNISNDMSHMVRVNIALKDFYSVKPYLKKTKTKMRILNKKGFPFWCYRHPKLKWFLTACVCLLILFFYSFQYIWDIQISGNEKVSSYDILEYLAEYQIETGQKCSVIDCSAVEYMIREHFDEIGWVSVYFDHTRLCIEIKESLYEQYLFEDADGRQYDLVAEKDAQIYSIVTRAGTAVIKSGAYVKQGEVLVVGQFEVLNDEGLIKSIEHVKAEACIWGDVIYEWSYQLSEIELLALKIADVYDNEMLFLLAQQKISQYIENLEENGVIILDKNVMIDKKEKEIVFLGEIKAREQIGINLPVEEMAEYEFE